MKYRDITPNNYYFISRWSDKWVKYISEMSSSNGRHWDDKEFAIPFSYEEIQKLATDEVKLNTFLSVENKYKKEYNYHLLSEQELNEYRIKNIIE